MVPLSIPPTAASKFASVLAVAPPAPLKVTAGPPVGTLSDACAAGAAHASAPRAATSPRIALFTATNGASVYSHSIVPGGLLVMSSTTRPTGRISPIIRAAIFSSRS